VREKNGKARETLARDVYPPLTKLIGKMSILLIESGSMCKHQGSSEQSGSYKTLFSF